MKIFKEKLKVETENGEKSKEGEQLLQQDWKSRDMK